MKKSLCPVRPGHVYSFDYPRYNYSGLPEKWQVRRIAVSSVRDLRTLPLDSTTKKLNPTLRRGRILVTGEDLDLGLERSFYAERMKDLREIEPEQERGYAVVVGDRIRYRTDQLCAAIAFRVGRGCGTVWGRLAE